MGQLAMKVVDAVAPMRDAPDFVFGQEGAEPVWPTLGDGERAARRQRIESAIVRLEAAVGVSLDELPDEQRSWATEALIALAGGR